MSQPNKGGPKKFNFGFPTKKVDKPGEKSAPVVQEDIKRKATDNTIEESVKKPRSNAFIDDDEDELLASAGIGK